MRQPPRRSLHHLLALASLAALVVASCQSAPDLSGRPTEADEPVINVSRFNTSDSSAARLGTMPVGTLYGDGRVITPGPQPAIEPPPALPALQVTTLDAAGIDLALGQAATAGLVGADRELRMPTEADPIITAFDVFLDGQRRRTIVESLAEIEPDDPRLPPKGQEERAAMNALVAMLTDPTGTLSANIAGETTPYEPTAVRLVISSADDLPPGGATVEWPLGDLATLGDPAAQAPDVRCAVVDGDDWATLAPIAGAANQATRWSSGGVEYAVRFRPILPGETGC